jgi:hypothetical protein
LPAVKIQGFVIFFQQLLDDIERTAVTLLAGCRYGTIGIGDFIQGCGGKAAFARDVAGQRRRFR